MKSLIAKIAMAFVAYKVISYVGRKLYKADAKHETAKESTESE